MTGPYLTSVVLAENCDRRQWVDLYLSHQSPSAPKHGLAAARLNPFYPAPLSTICPKKSGGRELGVGQRQPFHAVCAEVDLQSRVGAAFGRDDDAEAELGVLHALADTEATDRGGLGFS